MSKYSQMAQKVIETFQAVYYINLFKKMNKQTFLKVFHPFIFAKTGKKTLVHSTFTHALYPREVDFAKRVKIVTLHFHKDPKCPTSNL